MDNSPYVRAAAATCRQYTHMSHQQQTIISHPTFTMPMPPAMRPQQYLVQWRFSLEMSRNVFVNHAVPIPNRSTPFQNTVSQQTSKCHLADSGGGCMDLSSLAQNANGMSSTQRDAVYAKSSSRSGQRNLEKPASNLLSPWCTGTPSSAIFLRSPRVSTTKQDVDPFSHFC